MKRLSVFIVLIAIVFGVKAYLNRSAQMRVDEKLSRVDGFVDVEYDKARLDLLGWNPHLKNVTVSSVGTNAKTKIDDIIIYKLHETNEVPERLHIALKGIHLEVNTDNFGSQAENLKRMGYKAIKGDIHVDYEYDMEKKAFHLNRFRMGADDVGHIHAEFHSSNIDLNPDTIAFLLFSFPAILIHKAELRYEDDSLIPRLQKAVAEQQEKTVDELVAELTEEIDKEIDKTDNRFTQDALKAIRKFVKDPDEIRIIVSPQEPVSLGRIQQTDREKLPELLNIRIKT